MRECGSILIGPREQLVVERAGLAEEKELGKFGGTVGSFSCVSKGRPVVYAFCLFLTVHTVFHIYCPCHIIICLLYLLASLKEDIICRVVRGGNDR